MLSGFGPEVLHSCIFIHRTQRSRPLAAAQSSPSSAPAQFTRPKQARRRPARQNKRRRQEEHAPPAQHAGGPRRPRHAPQQQSHGSSAPSSALSSSIGKQDYRREDLVRMADAEFQRKLRDARSIEDLWELARDAEQLQPAAVAALPMTLLTVYEERPLMERQRVLQHAIFGVLKEPWALQPAAMAPTAVISLLSALVTMDNWHREESEDLVACISVTASALQMQLERGRADLFTPAYLCHIVHLAHISRTLNRRHPRLGRAALAASEPQLPSFRPGQLAWLASLCVSSHLRYNLADLRMTRLVVERGLAVAQGLPTPQAATQLLSAAASVRLRAPRHQQVLGETALRFIPYCDQGEMTNMMYALGHLLLTDHKHVLQAAEARLLQIMPSLPASTLSMAIWSFAAHRDYQPSKAFMQELSHQAMLMLSSFDAVTAAQLLAAHKNLRFRPSSALLEALAVHVETDACLGAPRSLAVIIWGLGGLDHRPGNLGAYQQVVADRIEEFDVKLICQIMVGLAHLGPPADARLLVAVIKRSTDLLDTFSPQGLGNLTYAFAKLGHHPGPLLSLLAIEADKRLPELNNFDCINIVWGFAKLGNYSLQAKLALKNILLALTQSLAQPGVQWKVQSYANIAWSMGQLGLEWPRLSQLILAKSDQCIELLTPLDVAHLLWGLATVDEKVPQNFIRRCMSRLLEHKQELELYPLSQALWSAAHYRHAHSSEELLTESQLQQAADHLGARMTTAEPGDIAGMVYAFGALRYHPGLVLEAAVAEVQRRPDQFLSKDWAALLQGMTRLLCDPGPLFGVLREQILLKNVEDDDVTLLSTALWSMGTSGAFQQPLFKELLSDAVRMPRRALEDSTLVPDLAVARIYQAYLLAVGARVQQLPNLPTLIEWRARGVLVQRPQEVPEAAQVVQEISDLLQQQGLAPQQGISAAGGLCLLDLAVGAPLQKVAVEVVARHQGIRNRHRTLTSRGVFRQRVLEADGWSVCHVWRQHWASLPDTGTKHTYLRDLLQPVLATVSGDECDSFSQSVTSTILPC